MEIKSLEELREVDERTLKFQPLGLGGRMRPGSPPDTSRKSSAIRSLFLKSRSRSTRCMSS